MPALQVVAKKPDGTSSPPSSEVILTTPTAGAPILTSADAWGPTSGQATATPPEGITFTSVRQCAVRSRVLRDEVPGVAPCRCCQQTNAFLAHISLQRPGICLRAVQYTFTACPRGGGPCVTVTSTDPDARFYNLMPGTEASHTVLVHWPACHSCATHPGLCDLSVQHCLSMG